MNNLSFYLKRSGRSALARLALPVLMVVFTSACDQGSRSFQVIDANSASGSESSLAAPAPLPTPVPIPIPVPAPVSTPAPNPSGPQLFVSPAGNDANAGTQTAPLRSIKKAVEIVKAGATVHVAPGTYAGDIRSNINGTAANPIRFVSDVKWGAKINSGSSSDTAWDNRAEYVTIEGFEVDGSLASGWRFGIYSAGGNSAVLNNKVHDIMTDPTQAAAAGSNGGAGIGADNWYGGSNIHVMGNLIYNIGPAGVRSNLIHGIYQIAAGTVANNIVYNTAGVGIHLWHDAHDINIFQNTVYGARNAGILVGAGDKGIGGGALSSRAGDNISVANNIVVNSAEGLTEEGQTGLHNTYRHNLLFNNSGGNTHLQNGLTPVATVTADPLFVDAANGDFRLQSLSPAVDRGISLPIAPAVDFSGAARPQGAGYDIGAFESR